MFLLFLVYLATQIDIPLNIFHSLRIVVGFLWNKKYFDVPEYSYGSFP